jgi:hypothetical protein
MIALMDFDSVEVARRLGHDLHRWTRLPSQPDWPAAIREGFDEAESRGSRRSSGDRFQRKWLQLRVGACRRNRIVADEVTPELLQQLDITHCPVTREALTHGTQADSDWSIDRLNNDGAYAASNLAVMSVKANRAKGALSFEQVLANSELEQPTAGLTPIQWLRLAVLMEGPAFATRPYLAPLLPLCAPLPCRSARLAVQQIQRLLTVQSHRPAGKNRLVRGLQQADGSEGSRLRLRTLADAVHEGLKRLPSDQECWDIWLQPGPMHALRQWRDGLDDHAWARTAAISGLLAGGRRVSPASLQAWHLPTRGYQEIRAQ